MTEKRTLMVPVLLKKGTTFEFEACLRKVIEKTRKESGCVFYRSFRISDREFVFFEQWADAESMRRHNESEHLRKFLEDIGGMVENTLDDVSLTEISEPGS